MTHPGLSLQGAMYQLLNSSSQLNEKLGANAIYDDVPDCTDMPYIVFTEATHSDWSTGTEDGTEHLVSLSIWSKEHGRKQVLELAELCKQTLKLMPVLLVDHTLVNFTHEFTEVGRDKDVDHFSAKLTFRAVTEPTLNS